MIILYLVYPLVVVYLIYGFITIDILGDRRVKNAERKLFDKLMAIARNENVPVIPTDNDSPHMVYNNRWAAGTHTAIGNCHYIRLAKSYMYDPYVLAHELGHYFSTKKNKDRSEESADRIGKKLCLSLLTKRQAKLLKYYIDSQF